MKNRVAVLTAVFPGVEPYLPSLVSSLRNQSFKNFDWVIINDGIEESKLAGIIGKDLKWINLDLKGVPLVKNRWMGIKYCVDKGYEYLVFQDGDDWMSWNRLGDSIDQLSAHSIVFNNLALVAESGEIIHENIWDERLKNGFTVEAGFIEDKNCIGLGNAALRSSIIPKDMELPDKVVAVDWFVFYQLIQDRSAIFSSGEKVFYRQHETNMAGIGLLNEDRIRRAFHVKTLHYNALVKNFPALKEQQKKLEQFAGEVLNSPSLLSEYIFKNKLKGISSFWWEETNYSI